MKAITSAKICWVKYKKQKPQQLPGFHRLLKYENFKENLMSTILTVHKLAKLESGSRIYQKHQKKSKITEHSLP